MFLGISNFLEEISSLSYSGVSIYFFALITEEGFLISPYYSLKLCIQMGISFLCSLPLASLRLSCIWINKSFINIPAAASLPLLDQDGILRTFCSFLF